MRRNLSSPLIAIILCSTVGTASAQAPDRPKTQGYNPLVGVPGYSNEPVVNNSTQYVRAQVIDPRPRTDKKPVTIRVEGNRLVFESDDLAALDAMTSYLAAYSGTGSKPTENLFKVIRLRNVLAEDAARTVSDLFNGPQQQQRQGGAGGGGPGGGGPGGGGRGGRGGGGSGGLDIGGLLMGLGGASEAAPTAPSGANPNRVRVVAERGSNSLVVVKASPIDLLTIESLLSNYIDAGPGEDAVASRTWIVPIHNADATEIATVVRDLYRSSMGTGGQSGSPSASPFGAPSQQSGSNGKAAALSVSVDDRSNSLILNCNEPMKAVIVSLVTQLDQAAVRTTEVVKLVQLKGVDPYMLQQAVDAIQGINSSAHQQPGGMGGGGMSGGGAMGGGGLGGGGMMGGMGGGGMGGGGMGSGGMGGGAGAGRGGAAGGRGGR